MRIESNEEIERNYNIKSLEDCIEYTKEAQDQLDKYITKVEAQIEKVHNTTFERIVFLRRNEWSKPIEYSVSLHAIPNIKGGEDTCYPISHYHYKNFVGGKRKKEAILYAETLAKEQGGELRRGGF